MAIKVGARTVEMRTQPRAPLHITCSRYRETPNYGERLRSWKQRRCRCARKSDPMNGCATPYHHNEGKWLCQHFEAVALPLPDGATAITRVEHRRRSRLCFTRPQYESFTLTKQCRTTTHTQRTYYLDASPAMLTRQVLGCHGSEPTGGRPAGSQLAAVYLARIWKMLLGQSLGCRREADRPKAPRLTA